MSTNLRSRRGPFGLLAAAALFSSVLTACGDKAGNAESAKEADVDSVGQPVTPPAESGVSELQQRIDALEADLTAGKYGLIDEVLVQHAGDTVLHLRFDRGYEAITAGMELEDQPFDYANPAWHPYYRDTQLHTLQSVTKSVTSVVIGILEYQGAIPNVAEGKVLELVDDRYEVKNRDENFEAMTVEHLLTMRTNLEWNESGGYQPGTDNDAVVLENETDDWVQYVLNKPLEGPPGAEAPYEYNSGASQVLDAIVFKATGKKTAEFAKMALFEPMGISDYYWKSSPAGETDTLGGLYLKSTDLVKFCELMSSGGVYNGQRLLSDDYVKRSLYYTTAFDEDFHWSRGYGYKWWLGDDATDSDTAFSGSGYGGQFPTCLPDKNTAIVIYSWNLPDVLGLESGPKSSEAGTALRRRISQEILPLLTP